MSGDYVSKAEDYRKQAEKKVGARPVHVHATRNPQWSAHHAPIVTIDRRS